jgi:hypothetical protein
MRTLQISVIVAVVACTSVDRTDPTDPGHPPEAPEESQVGESFILAPRQERSIPAIDLVVRFAEVPADHRCPRDVTCVWEGDAEVVVIAVQAGEERTFRLHTPRDVIGPTSTELDSGHRLELVRLEPEPVADRYAPRADYRAIFRVAAPEE